MRLIITALMALAIGTASAYTPTQSGAGECKVTPDGKHCVPPPPPPPKPHQ